MSEPRIVIGIVDKWPWCWSQWRSFVRHPISMSKSVRLFLLVKLIRSDWYAKWIEPKS